MKAIRFVSAAILLAVAVTGNAQKKDINIEKSDVTWTGKKIGGSHTGHVDIKSGFLVLGKHVIEDGEVVINMNSITNTDLKDPGTNAKLVGHLKSDDFFSVEKYPTAFFKITDATTFKKGEAAVTGKITIKGKTEEISFNVKQSGHTYTATVNIDRSKFDVRYGSKSFFDNLGDKAIDDIFTLEIRLVL